MAGEPPFSVVLPAHNEEDVIERCMSAIYRGAPHDARPEMIVAANGCKDRTVEMAKALAPDATVLDLPPGSKVIAMNEGNRYAKVAPRFMLDADVVCDYHSLKATADALREPGVMAAAPALRVDTSQCDSFVKSYYKVWMTQPYVRDRLVGSGLFGLSEEGLRVIGTIPPTFADDVWVCTRFSREQRRSVSQDAEGRPVFFTVSPPRTLRDHIKIEARRRIGSEQVNILYPNQYTGRINSFGDLGQARKEGASLVDVAIYIGMKLAARILFKWKKMNGRKEIWVRDINARQQS